MKFFTVVQCWTALHCSLQYSQIHYYEVQKRKYFCKFYLFINIRPCPAHQSYAFEATLVSEWNLTQRKLLGHDLVKHRQLASSRRISVGRDMGIPSDGFLPAVLAGLGSLRHFLWYVGQCCKLLSTITALRHRGLLSLLHHLPPSVSLRTIFAGRADSSASTVLFLVFISMLRIYLAAGGWSWLAVTRGEQGDGRTVRIWTIFTLIFWIFYVTRF